MASLAKVKNLLAISGLAIISLGMHKNPAQAAQVTFNFAGPVSSIVNSISSDDFLTGSVTFNTETMPRDIRDVGDTGERLLYPGAISDLTFSAGVVTESFQSGDIQVWNDYQMCIARRGNQCLQTQSERERLYFISDSSESRVQFIILGLEDNQELLTSGSLPTTLPLESNIFRVDFFWERFDALASIASNNIQLVRQPVPEPGTLGGTVFAVIMGYWLTRKR